MWADSITITFFTNILLPTMLTYPSTATFSTMVLLPTMQAYTCTTTLFAPIDFCLTMWTTFYWFILSTIHCCIYHDGKNIDHQLHFCNTIHVTKISCMITSEFPNAPSPLGTLPHQDTNIQTYLDAMQQTLVLPKFHFGKYVCAGPSKPHATTRL